MRLFFNRTIDSCLVSEIGGRLLLRLFTHSSYRSGHKIVKGVHTTMTDSLVKWNSNADWPELLWFLSCSIQHWRSSAAVICHGPCLHSAWNLEQIIHTRARYNDVHNLLACAARNKVKSSLLNSGTSRVERPMWSRSKAKFLSWAIDGARRWMAFTENCQLSTSQVQLSRTRCGIDSAFLVSTYWLGSSGWV